MEKVVRLECIIYSVMFDTVTQQKIKEYSNGKINLVSLIPDSEKINQYTTHYYLDSSSTKDLKQKQVEHIDSVGKLPYKPKTETILSVTTDSNTYFYYMDPNPILPITEETAQNMLEEKEQLSEEEILEKVRSGTNPSVKKYWIHSEYMSAVPYADSYPIRVPVKNSEVIVNDIVAGHAGDGIKKMTGYASNFQYNCLVRSADSFDISKISKNMFLKFDWDTYFFVEAVRDDYVVLSPVSKETMSAMSTEDYSLPDNKYSSYQIAQMVAYLDELEDVRWKRFSSF